MRRVPIIAVIAVGAAAAASQPASAARVYGGQPSAQSPAQLVFSLTNAGTRVTRLTFHLETSCAAQDFATFDFGTARIVGAPPDALEFGEHYLVGARVAGGRLTGAIRGVDRTGENEIEMMNVELSGNVGRSSARGSLAVRYTLIDATTGDVTGQCTRNVAWRATRRPGLLYAGATSQDAPVVLELEPGRRRVSHAHVSWLGSCEGGGLWMDAHDEFDLRPFALRPGGVFSRTYRFSFSDGQLVERFTGRVTRTRASGTFRGDATVSGDGGTDSCTSGPVRWTAATG